jgi:hypothetical protein
MYALYNSYRSSCELSNSEETPLRVAELVKDMESQALNLPPKEKLEVLNRIQAIKSTAKTQDVYNSKVKTCIQFTKTACDSVAGPIGIGVATYLTHHLENDIQAEESVINKARVVGGQRRKSKKAKIKKEKAIVAAAKAAFMSATSTLTTNLIKASHIFKWGASFFTLS